MAGASEESIAAHAAAARAASFAAAAFSFAGYAMEDYSEHLPHMAARTETGGVYATTLALMLAGGTAGVASWLFTYPIDIAKTLVQCTPMHAPKEQRTLRAVLAKQMAIQGPRFMLNGLTATLLRAFPCSAVTFPVWEWTLQLLKADEPHGHQEDLPMR